MDHFGPSVFSPFLRRFTDECARDVKQTRALFAEVGAKFKVSKLSATDARETFAENVFAYSRADYPESMHDLVLGAIMSILGYEKAIFDFPPASLDPSRLSLNEQLDLTRFLYAKAHALQHEEKVLEYLFGGIDRIINGLGRNLPSSTGQSPFSIPLIHTLGDQRGWVEGVYAILEEARYRENGLFTELYRKLYLNMCAVSGIADPDHPKKPLKLPTNNPAPIDEIVRDYLGGTPLLALFNAPVPLSVSYEDRFSHMHVVGGSGAGKTQLLQHLILHDLQSDDPPALVIVDSQTDLINKLAHLALFDPDTGPLADRLLYITPRDIQHPPALNIFDVNRERLGQYDEAVKEQVTAGVIQTFDYLFNGLLGADLTAKQGVFFRFVARLMLALPETLGRTATILDLINLMDDPAPYRKAIESLPPIQRNFFERDFASKTFVQTKEQIRYRLNAILENPTLARLFTSPSTKIDLFDALNNNAIILVDTAKDFLKGASGHFGRIFISLVLQAILERAAIPEHERKPAFLIVDEAAAYFDSNIDDLLTEARKYKLGCVFAHQFLDQCTSSLKSSLAANTAIKMASGVSTSDARALAPDLRTMPDFILNQPRLHFAAHIRNVTDAAISIPVPAGELERQPMLSHEAYERLREINRRKVSLPPALPSPSGSNTDERGAFDHAAPSPDDLTKPATEW
jgi:hypothetical protein